MTPQEENELFKLISAVCDEVATEEQNQQLHDLLRDSAEARRAYLNYVDLNFELADEFSIGAARAPIPMQPVKQRSHTGIYAAIAAVAVIALIISQLSNPEPIPNSQPIAKSSTTETDVNTAIGRILSVQNGAVARELATALPVHTGETIELTTAPIALEIGRTKVFAAGPGTLSITSETEIAIDSGRLVAISGEGDAGFIVQAPNCTITDLGTVFTVESGPVGTSTQVLQGAVEVEFADTVHALLPGGHLFVSADQKTTAVDEGDLTGFRNLLELAAGGVVTEGKVTALPQPTGFLSDTIRIWPEAHNHTLQMSLPTTFRKPGTYKKGTQPNGKLKVGTAVDSYMIFYRPHRRRNPTRQTGLVRFPRPILGVICHGYGLEKSDPVFVGPQRPDKVLSRTFNSEKDSVTIGEDGRSMRLNLSNNAAYSCEIRVLLEPEL